MKDRIAMGFWLTTFCAGLLVGMVLAGGLDRVEWTTRWANLEAMHQQSIAEITASHRRLDETSDALRSTLAQAASQQEGIRQSLRKVVEAIAQIDVKVEDAFTLFRRVPLESSLLVQPTPSSD